MLEILEGLVEPQSSDPKVQMGLRKVLLRVNLLGVVSLDFRFKNKLVTAVNSMDLEERFLLPLDFLFVLPADCQYCLCNTQFLSSNSDLTEIIHIRRYYCTGKVMLDNDITIIVFL